MGLSTSPNCQKLVVLCDRPSFLERQDELGELCGPGKAVLWRGRRAKQQAAPSIWGPGAKYGLRPQDGPGWLWFLWRTCRV